MFHFTGGTRRLGRSRGGRACPPLFSSFPLPLRGPKSPGTPPKAGVAPHPRGCPQRTRRHSNAPPPPRSPRRRRPPSPFCAAAGPGSSAAVASRSEKAAGSGPERGIFLRQGQEEEEEEGGEEAEAAAGAAAAPSVLLRRPPTAAQRPLSRDPPGAGGDAAGEGRERDGTGEAGGRCQRPPRPPLAAMLAQFGPLRSAPPFPLSRGFSSLPSSRAGSGTGTPRRRGAAPCSFCRALRGAMAEAA